MKLLRILSKHRQQIGLVICSGILSIVIFPSINLEWLAWIAFIPLFAAIQDATRPQAFWLGWVAGVIHFAGTLYWVTVAMVIYGNLPIVVGGAMLLLMATFLSLYVGAFCVIIRYLQQKTRLPLMLTAPVIWVGLEYLRSFFLFGFPWNLLGYCQFLTPYVTQIADITGVYGVSFLILLVNAGLYTCLFSKASRRINIRTAVITLCVLGGCIGYSLFRLSERGTPPMINVAVVQGNIDQSLKWNPQHRRTIFDTYIRLSRQTLEKQPELIVWPETAVPFVFNYDPDYRKELIAAVREFGTYLLFGGQDILFVKTPEQHHSFNSAFLLSPKGTLLAKYDKIHLVPFGEYVPYKKILFFIDKMVTAIGEVYPGTVYQVMPLPDKPFSTVICFEVIFPNLVRKFVDRGAQFLVTVTNDAWYGRTAAPYQHFAMATFRAIENHVSIARAANTGISGFIDPYGRILAQSDIFVEGTLVHQIPLRNTTTFYTRYGDLFARLCLILLIVGIGYGYVKR
jgi:apolipoprotein N-acyltransferase